MRVPIPRLVIIILLLLLFNVPLSNATRLQPKVAIDYVVQYLAKFPNLEFAEVMGKISKESNGDEKCKTWEPTVHEYSYGPLQILGSTAKLKGFKGKNSDLCTWDEGLYYGMSYLSDCKKRAVSIVSKDVLNKTLTAEERRRKIRSYTNAIYNAGRVIWKKGHVGEKYTNHDYVLESEYLYWKYKKYKYFDIALKVANK